MSDRRLRSILEGMQDSPCACDHTDENCCARVGAPCITCALAVSVDFGLEPITEEWLRAVGFRWHQVDRQLSKHWVLWIGGVAETVERERNNATIGWSFSSDEDLGIEVSQSENMGSWFCWFRSDTAHRYHRFIHLRHIYTRAELIQIVEALSGVSWKPENHRYGRILSDAQMERARKDDERFDRVLRDQSAKWYEGEKDDSRDGALPEHLEEHIQRQKGVQS